MIRFTELEDLGVAAAVMSDRSDGDCRLPGVSNQFAGAAGRETLLRKLGCSAGDLVCVRQVHGTAVLVAREAHRGHGGLNAADAPGEFDAILTDIPGLPIGVSIADCVPMLLFDPVRRAGGVVHAGREGTLANIAAAAIAVMESEFGSAPGDMNAVIGPSAGPTRYEVSPDMAEEFEGAGLPRNGRLLDLWGANRNQLIAAGVPERQILVNGVCTISSTTFFSHRSGADGARNLAVLVI